MDIKEEKKLIQKAKKDPSVFGVIFEENYDKIFAYCLKRTGNIHVAQDVSSEVFFKALDRLWQFRWKNISISSWLYRIATNEINQYYRKQKKNHVSIEDLIEKSGIELRDETDLVREMENQEIEIEKAESWREAQKHISRLPEKYQEALSLRFFEEKKISEIAEILGKKEGTIKSLISRGVSLLRERMNNKTQPKPSSSVIDTEEAIGPASKNF